MTQEEKARAYDEAIRKAAALYKASEPMSGCNVIIETLFPELVESEDEKVRKELIKETKGSEVRLFETVTNDEFVTWLENIPYTIDHEKREGFHLGYKAGFEEQGEHKPTDEEMKTLLRTEYEKGRADAIAEMQMEWSEEDEKMLNDAIGAVAAADYYTYDDKQEIEDWLKSIKNRVQPKQEWSEEDSFRTETLILVIKSGGSIRPELRNEYVAWLKSLRPQNHWKPSDRQMDSITCAVKKMKESACYDSELVSLLNDLKKLKEE